MKSEKSRPLDKPVLAVASGGGHWVELMLLRPALDQFEITYLTTDVALGARDGAEPILSIPDANRSEFFRTLFCMWSCWRMIRRLKPRVVITTGALPGLFCVIFARLGGAKTIWIDSIANSDKPSLSGRLAMPFANLWLSQWEELAIRMNLKFDGALL